MKKVGLDQNTCCEGEVVKGTVRNTELRRKGGRVTSSFLKGLRRQKWEEKLQWSKGTQSRMFNSQEVLPEMLQNYEVKMVIIGSDVVSLYPNLEISRVLENVKEAILRKTHVNPLQ